MILVAGAGAIGQLVAARLQVAGHDVQCLVRQRFVAPLQKLQIRGETEFEGPIDAVTEPSGTYHSIILTCKAHQTVTTAQQTASHLSDDGFMVSLQNGLGNGEKLRSIVGANRAAVALTGHGVAVESPGKLYHAGTGTTQIGPADPNFPGAAKQAQALLDEAGLQSTFHDSIRAATWTKAIVNASLNPVAALYDCTNGEVLADPDKSKLCQALAVESGQLAQRARVAIDNNPWPLVKQVLERTSANTCSMVQDVRGKRPTEIEQITGRMVRLNERLLGSMPKSEAIYGRIKDLESSYMGAAEAKQMAWDELEWEREPF